MATPANLDRICRLCGEEKPRLRSIFDQTQEPPLPQIIGDVVRLSILPDDGLPQNVCRHCTATLLMLDESVELFRSTDLKLRKQLGLGQVEIKLEEETEMEVEALNELCQQELDVNEFNAAEDSKRELLLDEPLAVKEEFVEEEEEVEYLDEEQNDSEDTQDANEDDDVAVDEADEESKPLERDLKEAIKEEHSKPAARKRGRPRVREIRQTPKRAYRKGGSLLPRQRKIDPSLPQRNDFKCYICNSESLGSAEALLVHLNDHTDSVPYTCTECVMEEVVIKAVSTLNLHKRMHLHPCKCPMCDKRFTSKNSVRLHIQTHHVEHGPMTCERCGKVCPSKVSLRDHMKLHTTAAPCEYCGRIFKETHKLKLHIERRHIGVKYECHLCHKKLASLDSVQLHIKAMHSTQRFECTICSKSYGIELSYRNHMKKHEANPNYEPAKQWQEHYTVVEGEEGLKNGVRLKKCNICGEIKSAIVVHLKAAHFPDAFRCEYCNETFKKKQYYEDHVLEHTNGKAYKCPICGREFTQRKNLMAHMQTKKHRDHPLAKSLDWLEGDPSREEKRQQISAAIESMRNQEVARAVEDIDIGEDSLM